MMKFALAAIVLVVPGAVIAQSAEVTVAPAALLSYAGSYQTEGPKLVVSVDLQGRLSVAPQGQEPRTLRATSQTEFLVEGTPMRIVFHPQGGKTESITVYRGTRELHGKRVVE